MQSKKKGRVAIDFDGVIHSYASGFQGLTNLPDPPVRGAFDFIRLLLGQGYDVAIYTTRAVQNEGADAVRSWLLHHGLEEKIVNKIDIVGHKPIAIMYIDDRGWCFTGKFPTLQDVENFRPWTGLDSSSK